MAIGNAVLTLMLVPGFRDAGPGHWQSLWEKQFSSAVRVVQDRWEDAHCDEWIQKLERTIAATPGSIVLAAHGLGCAAVIQWAHQQSQWIDKIQGALLVAPPDPMAEAFEQFTMQGFEALPLEKLPFKTILVVSSNDPYLSLQTGNHLADHWGSELVNIGPKGHINADSQLGNWEEGKALLDKLTL